MTQILFQPMTMRLYLQGPVEILANELDSTRSAVQRMRILRKLALSHSPAAIDVIVPYLGDETRVKHAAVRALVLLGEQVRGRMLEILADGNERGLHAGAVLVLAAIIRAHGRTPDP
jgi:hypothetical protein